MSNNNLNIEINKKEVLNTSLPTNTLQSSSNSSSLQQTSSSSLSSSISSSSSPQSSSQSSNSSSLQQLQQSQHSQSQHILNNKKNTIEILSYNGQTIITASSQGNLPICVLLWGMASAKRINIMLNDIHGNNPMHYACLAPTAEVMSFFHQQLKGMLTPEIRLVDSINNLGETPLLRAMSTGQMLVIKVLFYQLFISIFNYFFINCYFINFY